MEYRQLGGSGLKVPILTLGTGTFGGSNEFFKAWGGSGVEEATRLADISLEAGLNMFDSADGYSAGMAEEILGQAIKGRRDKVLISTKGTFPTGDGPSDVGSSRHHLINAVECSLRRLGTDYIDLYQLHAFDAFTPVEEALSTLDDLVRAGKIRYIGCSNFSGWHLMKSLAVSEKYGLARYVAHQAYYSLIGRDYEWELMPLGLDQRVGAVVWSPLGWARLTGKIRRGQPIPEGTRGQSKSNVEAGPQISQEYLYTVVDALDAIAAETGKTVPQIALNWLLQRPTVATLIIGARNEEQLRANLDAIGWNLSADHLARLDCVSAMTPPYPYWHQRAFLRTQSPAHAVSPSPCAPGVGPGAGQPQSEGKRFKVFSRGRPCHNTTMNVRFAACSLSSDRLRSEVRPERVRRVAGPPSG
jgi:aryl-alcohol dehydrogenase-like predicted oxidoreductase